MWPLQPSGDGAEPKTFWSIKPRFRCSDYSEEQKKKAQKKINSAGSKTQGYLISESSSHQIWDLVFTNSLPTKNFTALVWKMLQGEKYPGSLKYSL